MINASQAGCVSHDLLDILPHWLELWGLQQPRASSEGPTAEVWRPETLSMAPAGSVRANPPPLFRT